MNVINLMIKIFKIRNKNKMGGIRKLMEMIGTILENKKNKMMIGIKTRNKSKMINLIVLKMIFNALMICGDYEHNLCILLLCIYNKIYIFRYNYHSLYSFLYFIIFLYISSFFYIHFIFIFNTNLIFILLFLYNFIH